MPYIGIHSRQLLLILVILQSSLVRAQKVNCVGFIPSIERKISMNFSLFSKFKKLQACFKRLKYILKCKIYLIFLQEQFFQKKIYLYFATLYILSLSSPSFPSPVFAQFQLHLYSLEPIPTSSLLCLNLCLKTILANIQSPPCLWFAEMSVSIFETNQNLSKVFQYVRRIKSKLFS